MAAARMNESVRNDAELLSRRRIAAAGGVWHKVLQVGLSATQDEVKSSYRKLVLLHHPDKNGSSEDDTFKLLQVAYRQALTCCKSSTSAKPTKTAMPAPKPKQAAPKFPTAPKSAATKKSPWPFKNVAKPKATKPPIIKRQEVPIPKAPIPKPTQPTKPRKRAVDDSFYGEFVGPSAPASKNVMPGIIPGMMPTKAASPKQARRNVFQSSAKRPRPPSRFQSKMENDFVMYTDPAVAAQPMPCARELATEACKKGDLKSLLLQRLFLMEPGATSPMEAPVMPANGVFKEGVQEYMLSWGTAISCDVEGLVFQEASRVISGDSDSSKSSPMHAELIHEVGWTIEALTGYWHTGDERDRGGFHITRSKDGKFWMSNGDRTLTSPMQKATHSDDWSSAVLHDREIRFRLKDWNTLEVSNGARIERSPEALQNGSIVLISGKSWRGEAVPSRIGIVERRYNRPVVSADAAVVKAFGQETAAEIHVLRVGLVPYVRELKAVKNVKEVPQQLLGEILGSSPPTKGQVSLRKPNDRGPLPCLSKLNESQLRSVEIAGSRDTGFTLIWGPPGTGKSATLLALMNALHVQEYEKMHKAIEDIALGRKKGTSDEAQWYQAVRLAPRILVAASTNTAVEGLIERVHTNKLLDRQGNMYEPWGMVRVGNMSGTGRAAHTLPIDLDVRVNDLLSQTPEMIEEQFKRVKGIKESLGQQVLQLRQEIRILKEVFPLPHKWEARLSKDSGMVEFHDHNTQTATYQKPDAPPAGADIVQFFDCAHSVGRLAKLIQCAEQWWSLSCQEKRFAMIAKHNKSQMGSDGVSMTYQALRQQLERSFLESAHVVFSTLSSAARLLPADGENRVKSFGAVIIDEAAQATETSVLVPLQLAHARRCVLVGDDRQLAPTVFAAQAEHNLAARSLFERLRQVGHRAELLELQYRMSPEISAFPRSYFYGGALRDAPGMDRSTARKLHSVCPPLLFVDLASSEAQRGQGASWRNWEEARVCAKILTHLCTKAKELGEPYMADDVGIITGYRAQQDVLKQALRREKAPVGPDVVRTVDGYQGRECEIVVLSAVRAPDESRKATGNLGFLADDRRLNVAITRAKSILVVVGHAQTLARAPAWSAFLDHVRSQPGAYHTLASSAAVTRLWRALDPEI